MNSVTFNDINVETYFVGTQQNLSVKISMFSSIYMFCCSSFCCRLSISLRSNMLDLIRCCEIFRRISCLCSGCTTPILSSEFSLNRIRERPRCEKLISYLSLQVSCHSQFNKLMETALEFSKYLLTCNILLKKSFRI